MLLLPEIKVRNLLSPLTENGFFDSGSQTTELQIRGGIEDNSKIFFLISQRNICCDSSLELSQ